MNKLVKTILVLLLISCILPPKTEAASALPTISITQSVSNSPSFSGSQSVSNSPSFSGSSSISYSTSLSYSPSIATISISTSGSLSINSLSTSMSVTYSAFTSTSATNSSAAQIYSLTNRCSGQADTICPFWTPDAFPKYRLECMNFNGSMLTINNIVVSPGQIPQYQISSKSSKAFITSGQTYRCAVYGCDASGINCIQPWTPIVVTLPEKKRTTCDPGYACNLSCTVPTSGVVECSWANSQRRRYKMALIRATECVSVTTLQPLAVPNKFRRIFTAKRPQNPPSSLRLNLPPNAVCVIQLFLRYHLRQLYMGYTAFT
jgi:hypothetical protein